jgi:ATP-binding cassette subfamily F protein uup
MDALRREIDRLHAVLNDPGFYVRDSAAFDRTVEMLHVAEASLAAAEDQWLTLELKREEIEGT